MSELHMEIAEMLEQGYNPKNIARVLDCPLSMVYEVLEQADKNENFSPFETINS